MSNSYLNNRRRIRLVVLVLVFFIIIFTVVFTTKKATAKREGINIKRVTNVEIQKGDTLWSIASEYMSDEYKDLYEYIDEIMLSNGLVSDTIHAGNYIIVPYYIDWAGQIPFKATYKAADIVMKLIMKLI